MEKIKVTAIDMMTGKIVTFETYRDNLGGIAIRGMYLDILTVEKIDK